MKTFKSLKEAIIFVSLRRKSIDLTLFVKAIKDKGIAKFDNEYFIIDKYGILN